MPRKYVQDSKPPRSAAAEAWLEEEVAEQQRRYDAIVAEMDSIESDREKWYAQFLEIIQTKGFNVTGDQRRVIPADEIPEKPDRDDAMRVVW